jgi:hypothetical protein
MQQAGHDSPLPLWKFEGSGGTGVLRSMRPTSCRSPLGIGLLLCISWK